MLEWKKYKQKFAVTMEIIKYFIMSVLIVCADLAYILFIWNLAYIIYMMNIILITWNSEWEFGKKVNRNVLEEPQAEATANPRHQEEEKK